MRVRIAGGFAELEVEPRKAQHWIRELARLAEGGALGSREAARLAGKLSFGCAAVWAGAPRAQLRPLFRVAAGLGPDGPEVREALSWWAAFLAASPVAVRALAPPPAPPVLLYTDAEGAGGAGAVLYAPSGAEFWASSVAPLRPWLAPRATQINPFELATVILAISFWGPRLRGASVCVFIDNTVALACARKGTSSACDLARLSFALWARARAFDLTLRVAWVPSKLNPADAPSRGGSPAGATEARLPPELLDDLIRCLSRAPALS